MYFYFTGALNDLFVEKLREFWSYHPRFKDLVDNIQGKYSFQERPQRGIVVKTSGGNNVRMTWDNFMDTDYSYVFRAKVGDYPGVSVEWVREDAHAIQRNNGVFPAAPGIYLVSIVDSELDPLGFPTGRHKFVVDSILRVVDEGVAMVDPSTGLLARPFTPGSLRLYELPSNLPLVEGVNFTADSETGEITLAEPLPPGLFLSADYKYTGESRGPYDIESDRAHFTAIPGVILAFGRRITPGDKLSVIVTDIREPVALIYGGRWDFSVDIDLWARDVDDQREMTDLMLTWMPSILRSRVAHQGVWINEVSFGGETEEPYDENADDYFYGASISINLQTDWQVDVPLAARINQILPLRAEQAEQLAGLSDEEVALEQSNFQASTDLRLRSFEDPFFYNLFRRYAVAR